MCTPVEKIGTDRNVFLSICKCPKNTENLGLTLKVGVTNHSYCNVTLPRSVPNIDECEWAMEECDSGDEGEAGLDETYMDICTVTGRNSCAKRCVTCLELIKGIENSPSVN